MKDNRENDNDMTYMNKKYRLVYTMLLMALLTTGNATAGVKVRGNVYGGGNLAPVSGSVTVNMTGSNGVVEGDVYGGGALADTNTDNWVNDALVAPSYNAVTLTKGTSLAGYYSKSGDSYTLLTSGTAPEGGGTYYKKTETIVVLTGGTVNGDAYGGGLGRLANGDDPSAEGYEGSVAAMVYGDATVIVKGTKMQAGAKGRVFGANNVNGTPKGHVKVVVNKTTAYSSGQAIDVTAVFGGGNQAAYEPYNANDFAEVEINKTPSNGRLIVGNVFGGGNEAGIGNSTTAAGTQVNIIAGDVKTGVYGGCNTSGTVTKDVTVNVTGGNIGTDSQTADVFGGGLGRQTLVNGSVTVNIGERTGTSPNFNYSGSAVIYGDVYGGSARGNVNAEEYEEESTMKLRHHNTTTTLVNLYGGTINGGLYGGGLGDNTPGSEIAANVYGPVTVTVEGGKATNVFGCNNLYGTPQKTVQVVVNGTEATVPATYYAAGDNIPEGKRVGDVKTEAVYALQGVYGGGNLAHFDPTTPGNYPTVTVNGCSTSIKDVYGGGNAAAVPYTSVTINGGDIDRVFAGGNGESGTPAHVGWKNINADPTAGDYGAGTASAIIAGGTIRQIFGGSNANGTIRVSSSINIDKSTADNACPMIIGEVYRGGNEAPGTPSTLTIGCTGSVVEGNEGHKAHPENIGKTLEGIGALYGGANAADVIGDIELTIGSGIIANVFGGNNTRGSISGAITVNVEKNAESCGWYVGNVFGGGNLAEYDGTPVVNIKNGTVSGNVYGGGNGDPNDTENPQQKGSTGAPTVTIGDLTEGHSAYQAKVLGEVYGGGNAAKVTGETAPTVLVQKCNTQAGYVYGGGNAANVPATNVTITGGTITGEVYGGGHGDKASLNQGENDHSHSDKAANVTGDVTVNVYGGTIAKVFAGSNLNGSISGTVTMSINKSAEEGACDMMIGEVYGGGNQAAGNAGTISIGCTGSLVDGENGHAAHPENIGITLEGIGTVYGGANAANIGNNIELNITGGIIENVFGGNNTSGTISGTIEVNINKNDEASCAANWYVGNVFGGGNQAAYSGTPAVNIQNGQISHNVFGGGNEAGVGGSSVSMTGGSVLGAVYGGCNTSGTVGGDVAVTLSGGQVGTSSVHGNVHGGGYGPNTYVSGDVEVNVGTATGSTPAYTGSAVIYGDVYGGGALGHVNAEVNSAENATMPTFPSGKTTTVNLNKGTIHGDVYGGGLGDASHAAYVGGAVNVNLHEVAFNVITETKQNEAHEDVVCATTGRIFGCNNQNGTPKGHVTVHVYHTEDSDNNYSYDLAAVFGGGNEADYVPSSASDYAEVIVEGCGNSGTSIKDLYGGGNAADVPATTIWILGSDIIDNVFGGGNGELGPSYAANVSGATNVNLVAGNINNVYGGSNSNGDILGGTNVVTTSLTEYKKNHSDNPNCCDKLVTQHVYGGGNQAEMTGDVNVTLECMPEDYVDAVYGGAANAVVNGNVTLTVTSGKFGKVFGGNDTSGSINGSITVNIREEGCEDLEIGELYGGGNLAPYSMYGYTKTNNVWAENENTEANLKVTNFDVDKPNTYPIRVFVESCTSIGRIYGGGLGSTATVTGGTYININMLPGSTIVNNELVQKAHVGRIGQVFGGGKQALLKGNAVIDIGTETARNVPTGVNIIGTDGDNNKYINPDKDQYSTTPRISITNAGVYGGGEAADVEGSTTLNIGTKQLSEGTNITGNIYGGGLGSGTHVTDNVTVNIGRYNTDTEKNVGYAVITGDVYGGSAQGKVNATTSDKYHEGKVTEVNYFGGTITGNIYGGGHGSADNAAADVYGPITVNVYDGCSNSSDASNANSVANVFGGNNLSGSPCNSVDVNIMGGTISENVYGGGNNADALGDVTVDVTGGSMVDVYGGGKGQNTVVGGNVEVNIGEKTGTSPDFSYSGDASISGNIYGGSALGAVNAKKVSGNTVYSGTEENPKATRVNIYAAGTIAGSVYGGGLGDNTTGSEIAAQNFGNTTVTMEDGTVSTAVYGGANTNGVLKKKSTVNIIGGTVNADPGKNGTIQNVVFGGGKGQPTLVEGDVEVNIGKRTGTSPNFSYSGTAIIWGHVYGGSAMGNVNAEWVTVESASTLQHVASTKTDVNLYGGTIYGDLYGGGLGDQASLGEDHTDIEANVYGPVSVTVDFGKANNVFGCNNLNGSPQNTVAVKINDTDIEGVAVAKGASSIGNVYGGGNRAKYTYTGATPLLVEINGGVVGNVYGGGLSADVAGSITVNIKDGKVQNDVYGGGALANTNTGNWTVDNESDWGAWSYVEKTLEQTTYYEPLGILASGTSVTGKYIKDNNNQYQQITDNAATADGTTEYYQQHVGKISAGYYQLVEGNYIPATTDWAAENTTYYSKQVKGQWAADMSSGTTYKTAVNLTGGIVGDVYGGGLGDLAELGTGHTNVSAIVYGDVSVTLGNGTNATGVVQDVEKPSGSEISVPISGRVFGCNNINGTPLGNVTVTVNNTQQLDSDNQPISGHSDNKYDVHSVYGGGNMSRYEPANGKETKVLIYGCEKTSIEKVFGGGNSAAVPKTTVVIVGTHRIGYVFGGGNGADMIKKGETWVVNDGAPVYGDATVIAIGGRIGMTFAGSDTKGAVWGNATTKLNDGNGNISEYTDENTENCPLKITHSYGAGRGADINSDVNFIVNGCTANSQIETIFGGSYDANIRGNINLTITGGVYTNVFGGNDHGGNIGGNITVNIEESETCNPTIIQYLYGGSREAAYPGADAKDIGGTSVSRGKITVNVKSATRIDNVYGGGWRAVINGDTEVNVNMIKGSWANSNYTLPDGYRGNIIPNSNMTMTYTVETVTVDETIVTGLYTKDGDDYIQVTEQEEKAQSGVTYYKGTPTGGIHIDDKIGTIGNVFGGSYQSEIHGNATVNIGTATEVDILKRQDEVDGGELLHPGAVIVDESNNSVYNESGKLTGILAYVKKPVRGARITGNVYGGGDLATMDKYEVSTQTGTDPETGDPIYSTTDAGGNTFVNICAVLNSATYDAVAEATEKVTIEGNVYGGGRGVADNFFCRKGMVGHEGDNVGQAPDTKDGTTIRIGNGTVKGSVYGGGEVARVEWSSDVTVGLTTGETSTPVIEGNIFGGGRGVSTHGYSALLRGDTHVTVQANAKVRKSVYGGGQIASVGRYNVALTAAEVTQYGVEIGMPYSLKESTSGNCYVTIQGNAEIGPVAAMQMTATGGPDFLGNVFGGGKGVLPYEGYSDNEDPWRMPPSNDKQSYPSTQKTAYLKYVETLALATRTFVTIDENAFVKGSVYGGSENGIVQQNTLVKIKGGQIGCGKNANGERYSADVWEPGYIPSTDAEDLECDSWTYGKATNDADKYAPYDKYYGTTGYDSKGGRLVGDDGHTYYGNVFGGGSGKDPYRPGEWHWKAGAVNGNTEIQITGGHILTNVYGGNELTNIGTDGIDSTGVCTIIMSGGSLGVPRTLTQIKDHPVTCYLFGAGKGDQRVLFNKQTNVKDVVMSITGGTIYGSVFGGGEDGHVMRDVQMTIGNNGGTGPTIGTWGTSYVDGNVFGGGRGFAGDAYTAGNVAGSIKLDIKGGTMLGSVYGGGRLASVGYGLFESTNTANYGVMQDDNKDDGGNTTEFFTTVKATNHILTTENDHNHNLGLGRGHIVINISGGTIGNNYEFVDVPTSTSDLDAWKTTNHVPNTEYNTTSTTEGNTTTYTHRLKHTKGGNVFAGSMGRRTKIDGNPIPEPTQTGDIDWKKLGNAKSTKLTISGDAWIMGNVYGGCEFGSVTGYHDLLDGSSNPMTDANGKKMVAGTEIVVTGGTIGTEITASTPVKTTASDGTVKYTFGSIYGGGMGIETDGGGEVKDSTNVNVSEASGSTTLVRASVFGGGEMGDVDGNTLVTIAGGKIGRNEVRPANSEDPKEGYVMFGGATMGNVYGGGFGSKDKTKAALVKKNTRVIVSGGEIYHNVYGGGALSSVGTFSISDGTGDNAHIPEGIPYGWTDGTGTATVIVTGGTIGISGRDNGMVNGSSRGEVAKPVGDPAKDPYDKVAWVNETLVTIGKTGETGPNIKGSVYGGGENGHNAGDATVKMYSGKVGAFTGDAWETFTNATAIEKATITRGNVYGAGCGTDTYTGDDGLEHNNPWAGLVAGNTTVTVSGGEVSNSVYGGGSMGAVGTITNDLDDAASQHKSGDNENLGEAATLYDFGLSWPLVINYASETGKASVTVDGTAHIYGYVFGAAKGKVDIGENDITKHRYVEAKFANVRETQVTIGTAGGSAETLTPTIERSVFGGGEDGHVYENASVTIHHGNIKRSVFGGGKGEGKYTTELRKATGDPNGTEYEGLPNQDVYSWTAGRVYGNTTVTMKGGQVGMFIYGGGNLGSVGKGNYAGGSDDYSIGGYGELPSEGGELWSNTNFTSSGKATVNLFGGTVGDGSGTDDDGIPYGSVFGGSRGKAAASCKRSPRYRYVPDFFLGYVNKAEVNIGDANKMDDDSYYGPKVYGSIYGGGQDGHVRNNTVVKIYKGDIAGHTSDATGRSGNVFGAGSGIGTYIDTNDGNKKKVNNSSGSVTCTTLVEVNGGTIAGNVYGGGALASVGPPKTPAQTADEQKAASDSHTSYSFTRVDVKGGKVKGNVFGASRGPGDSYLTTEPVPVFDTAARVVGEVTLPAGSYDETKYATDIWSYLNVTGGIVEGSVYGGGEGGIVKHDTEVHLTGGTITNDAYGGGKGTNHIEANVGGNTTVMLNEGVESTTDKVGCSLKRIFGCNDLKGTPQGHVKVHVHATRHKDKSTISDNYAPPYYNPDRKVTDQASTTEGYKEYLQRLINVAYTKDANDQPTTTFIDGINTDVETAVTAAKTVMTNLGSTAEESLTPEHKDNITAAAKGINNAFNQLYDVQAVYGGGNLAAYVPTITTEATEVIIDGCGYTSIRQVYGGGNAASTPANEVTVNKAYVIDEVFGGGNGADNYLFNNEWYENPGANVGYKSTSYHVTNGETPGTQEEPYYKAVENEDLLDGEGKPSADKRLAAEEDYHYGTGEATTKIFGGTIHRVYGGSNQKGYVRGTATSLYESKNDCPLVINETYGAGKNAPVDGSTNMNVDCAKGIEEIFGGSKESDVNSDIHLVITNGSSLKRVFGGNNTSGNVNGTITVDIIEGGCEPIHIEELYAGGYLAPYSVYGYKSRGVVKTKEDGGEKLYKDPVINVISANRIDNIFGGGYQATVVGDPHINVNMTKGKVLVEKKETTAQNVANLTNEWYTSESTTVEGQTITKYYVYKDAAGTPYKIADLHQDGQTYYVMLDIGTIGTIYGGGNLADIIGDTYVDIGTGEWLNIDRQREMLGTAPGIDTPTLFTYKKPTEEATSEVWTYTTTTTTTDPQTEETTTTTTITPIEGTPTPVRNEAIIEGNVYGGGKGVADHFECAQAMVGVANSGKGNTNVTIGNGSVGTLENGKLVDGTGNVYGGGQIGRVENNTSVTIGLESGTGEPVILGNVFGAGKGVNTHGYSALVRGSSAVVVQGKSKVRGSVYGGGEKASVGKYIVVDGLPQVLFDDNSSTSGYCYVTIKDNAEIGPDNMQMFHDGVAADVDQPDDAGHVFGAGKGILPYEGYEDNEKPYHMNGIKNGDNWTDDPKHYKAYNELRAGEEDADYFKFIKSLALATETHVTIKDNAFVKGSVYGGSENGFVQHNTHVLIDGNCQIGNGFVQMYDSGNDDGKYLPAANWVGVNRRYTAKEWEAGRLYVDGDPDVDLTDETESALKTKVGSNYTKSLPECASWLYGIEEGTGENKKIIHAPHDKYASAVSGHEEEYSNGTSTEGGRRQASDGHTFYGNVFGGGSGYYPYRPGKWFESAGAVLRNTYLTIKGGHILTSVYGGNEMTDVGKYETDANGDLVFVPDPDGKDYGTSYVTMTGGTLGVPRTLKQIATHPVTCYLFGAGKGDQRVFFNESTDVGNAVVHISDDARIYGSVFGGGEDGHVMENVKITIGSKTLSTGSASAYTDVELAALTGSKVKDGIAYPYIGTWGTSYVEGNVFGAGRGFSGDALTAGSVGGNVELSIAGGTMLGSVYGGGRLASVGIGFKMAHSTQYGQFQPDTSDKTHGHITVNISGGTIGNNIEDHTVEHTKGGNVFGGSMGRLELLDGSINTALWSQLGQVKSTTVNISQKSDDCPTIIKSSVYGGAELGTVRDNVTVVVGKESKDGTTITNPTIIRDVYGGGYGSLIGDEREVGESAASFIETKDDHDNTHIFRFTPMQFAGCVGIGSEVNIYGGWIKRNVYGGGENASVGILNYEIEKVTGTPTEADVTDTYKGETYRYKYITKHHDPESSFALSWPYKVEYLPDYPGNASINVYGGRLGVSDEESVWDDNGDIYGGSKGKAGDRYKMAFCGNVGSSNILIEYPNDDVTPDNYMNMTNGKYDHGCIVGAVYGGGEDGHVMGDTHVTLKKGLIGHALYGGGSGKGKYEQALLKIGSTTDYISPTPSIYSITAGKVYGNTHVKMEGGYVRRFVYGGGNMGSVGKGNYASGSDDYFTNGYGEKIAGELWKTSKTAENPDDAWEFLNSGKTKVEISGGQVGYVNKTEPTSSMKDGLPYGSVFGGSRGESAPNIKESPRYWYSPETFSGYVNETEVIIGDATKINDENYTGPKILGSVFGGGQDGHVRRDTHVIVDAGEIGLSLSGNDLDDSQTNEEILGDISTNGKDNPQWLHRGNVYGGGSGIGKYVFDFENDGTFTDANNNGKYDEGEVVDQAEYQGKTVNDIDYSTSAGSVTRFTQVDIHGGTIHRNVYGGGSLSSIGPLKINQTYEPYKKGDTAEGHGLGLQSQCTVNIGGKGQVTIGTPTDYKEHYGGEVYGASRGDLSIGEDFGVSVWTQVFIKNGARIMGNVFGGGDNGKVKRDTDVQIGEPATTP